MICPSNGRHRKGLGRRERTDARVTRLLSESTYLHNGILRHESIGGRQVAEHFRRVIGPDDVGRLRRSRTESNWGSR